MTGQNNGAIENHGTGPGESVARAAAKESGFDFDGVCDWPNGRLWQFTRRNVPASDPVYGATFYTPEGASREFVLQRAAETVRRFMEGARMAA